MLSYEHLDNLFTPNRGLVADGRLTNDAETWGGDDNFNRLIATARYYYDILDNLVLGMRLSGAHGHP